MPKRLQQTVSPSVEQRFDRLLGQPLRYHDFGYTVDKFVDRVGKLGVIVLDEFKEMLKGFSEGTVSDGFVVPYRTKYVEACSDVVMELHDAELRTEAALAHIADLLKQQKSGEPGALAIGGDLTMCVVDGHPILLRYGGGVWSVNAYRFDELTLLAGTRALTFRRPERKLRFLDRTARPALELLPLQ